MGIDFFPCEGCGESIPEPGSLCPDCSGPKARVLYRNRKGETAWRTVVPLGNLYHGSNEWHREPQYLMDVFDVDRHARRTFAMKDVLRWCPDDGACDGPVPQYETELWPDKE